MTFLQGGGEGGIIKIITRIFLRRWLQCSKRWLSFSNYCLQSVLSAPRQPLSVAVSNSTRLQALVYVILPPTPPTTGLCHPSSNTYKYWSTSSFLQHLQALVYIILFSTPPSTGLRHPSSNTSWHWSTSSVLQHLQHWSTSSFLQNLQAPVYFLLPPTPPSTGLRHPFFNTSWLWSASSFLQHLQVLVYVILPPTSPSTGRRHPFHNTAIISYIIGLGKLWANCFLLVLKWQYVCKRQVKMYVAFLL